MSSNMLKEYIDSDKKRYGEVLGLNKPLYYRWQLCYRKASAHGSKSIIGVYYRIKLKRLSEKSGIQIPTACKIGKGLFLAHNGSIIINPNVVMGDNINLSPGVTIGKTNRGDSKGTPSIGNRVWFGTNSVIVGGITIGDDVLIAPGAYVNFDVPSHCIVLGNPGVIHHKDNATEGYINNLV